MFWGGAGGSKIFSRFSIFRLLPPSVGGEQTADFGVLPPTLGGSRVQFGVIRGEQGGQLSEIYKIKFPMTPPQSGGEHGGDLFSF